VGRGAIGGKGKGTGAAAPYLSPSGATHGSNITYKELNGKDTETALW